MAFLLIELPVPRLDYEPLMRLDLGATRLALAVECVQRARKQHGSRISARDHGCSAP